jgi:glycosyltransferase involved in cell wall biosynthesis
MLVNLIQGFIDLGRRVDLLLIRTAGPHLRALPPEVRQIPLGAGHGLTAIPALAGYLRRHRPPALLAAKDRAGRTALLARRLAGADTRIVLRLGTNLSAALEGRSALMRGMRLLPIRVLYPGIERIVAVSQGVANDTAGIAGVPRESITVIRNPVVTPALARLAAETCTHPWLRPGEPPLILGAGRLQRQKDFPTLIRAFGRVRRERTCRLAILGDGSGRAELEAMVARLGLADWVRLPGFQDNPFPWLSRASVFVLSSAWEGSPNVLTEAMALGTPVVSTDCPSGPAELLANGRFGPLVPVGDAQEMARAIGHTLDHPTAAETLEGAVAEYNHIDSARRYLQILDELTQ